jgi:hypothetical protein
MKHTIQDHALKEILAAELMLPDGSDSSVFDSFQRLATQTKAWLLSDQLEYVKRSFELVGMCYGKCSAKAQMAIENVFIFSIGCCLDGLSNAEEIRDMLPESLRLMTLRHRNAHDI